MLKNFVDFLFLSRIFIDWSFLSLSFDANHWKNCGNFLYKRVITTAAEKRQKSSPRNHEHMYLRGCLHDTGATFASERVLSGSLSWLYIWLHDTTTNVMPVRVTPAWVHPRSCTRERISLRYEISQLYHVNSKRPPVSVSNRSASRLERVAYAWCLPLWITRAFYQHV